VRAATGTEPILAKRNQSVQGAGVAVKRA
jgi:hypothetical protein